MANIEKSSREWGILSRRNIRVRNAQALRDERAFYRAEAACAPAEQLHCLRRKMIPATPCVDCGLRLTCYVCDKNEVSAVLLEDWKNPPPKSDIGIQANIRESMSDDPNDANDAMGLELKALMLEVDEAKMREKYHRKKICNLNIKVADMDRQCATLTDDLAARTTQWENSEAEIVRERERAEKAEQELTQLHKAKDYMEVSYEGQLEEKRDLAQAKHAARGRQHSEMNVFIGKRNVKIVQQQILFAWWWQLQEGKLTRHWEEKMAAQERDMRRAMDASHENILEEYAARYASEMTALELATAKKQMELKDIIVARDACIAKVRSELKEREAELTRVTADFTAARARLTADTDRWQEKQADAEAEPKKQQALAVIAVDPSGRLPLIYDVKETLTEVMGAVDKTKLKEQEQRINELEDDLMGAEEEYKIVSCVLEQCQHKVIRLRRRLDAEVHRHLESQVRHCKLAKERNELVLKLVAQRRCMKRQRVPVTDEMVRILDLKNELLVHQANSLRHKLCMVTNIAKCSPNKSVRRAIQQAAGKAEAKARRAEIFKPEWM
eukprot:GEMP01026293.1.p1 GENE.GEMP01026293.1~~GEMP01026293.1.p1  ORF type:complete len:556 (+),score=173.40 GEMP01026293.1:133-1800(+)